MQLKYCKLLNVVSDCLTDILLYYIGYILFDYISAARQEVDNGCGGDDDDGDYVKALAITRTHFASSGTPSCESEFLTTQVWLLSISM